MRCTWLVVLAILVAAFVSLYPYLAGMEMCEVGECPYAAQSSHGTSSGLAAATCVSAVLASSAAVLAFAASRGRCVVTVDRRPLQLYLSPDPPPPRLSPSL